MTNISSAGVDTSLDEVDPLFAKATVVQASEYRSHRRHHHRSRRKQRRNRVILLGAIAAAAVVVGVGALLVKRDDSSTATVAAVSPLTTTKPAPGASTVTTAAASTSAATWTYKDLKGQTIVVKPSSKGTTRFVDTPAGSLPYVIVNIDKSFATKGCEGGQAAYQQWNPVTPSALATPRYSAYTRYVVDKAKAMNCPWAASIPTP